jgi:chromosome segregation ATPase
MSRFPSNPERNRRNGKRPPANNAYDDEADNRRESPAEVEDPLARLRRLAGVEEPPPPEKGEGDRLRKENGELRSIIGELRALLDERAARGSDGWESREREFEDLLEQKSEEIRALHFKVKELEQELAGAGHHSGPAGSAPSSGEMSALREELVREQEQMGEERDRLRQEREQLREDEDDMMRRMREMELQAAKSRADLVRQRNEMQQLHTEVRNELEHARRSGAVNERMRNLEQQTQDVSARKGR